MVTTGRMLPANGNYFFVMEGGDRIVMRKCDRSIVARVAGDAHALAGQRPNRVVPARARLTVADLLDRSPGDLSSVHETVVAPQAP